MVCAALESPGSNFSAKKGVGACALTPGGGWGLPPGGERVVRRAYFGSLIQKWFHLAQTVVVMGFSRREKKLGARPVCPVRSLPSGASISVGVYCIWVPSRENGGSTLFFCKEGGETIAVAREVLAMAKGSPRASLLARS